MTIEVGKGTGCVQDTGDDNTIVEGHALTRVQVGGRDKTLRGSLWYVQVATDGDEFYGFAQDVPDLNGNLAALHTGIVKALPDLDDTEESGVVSLTVDDPLIIGTTAGRVRLWVDGVDDPADLIGWVEEPVQDDDPNQYITVRMN